MTERIKVNANEIRSSASRFKNISMNMSSILSRCDGTVNMLERSWGGQSRMDFLNRYHELRKQLNELPKIITEFSSYLELAARTMEQQDTALAKLMGIPSSGVLVPNDGTSIKSWDGKIPSQSNTFDDIVTDPRTAGVVSGADKGIGLGIESIYGKGDYISIPIEGNREFRRSNLPKEFIIEKPELMKLGKGFGILSTALAGVTVYEDYKNNDTWGEKAGAMVIDGAATYGSYAVADVAAPIAAGLAADAAIGLATAVGIVALPEIAVGAVAVGAAIGTAAVVGWIASEGASGLKGLFGLH